MRRIAPLLALVALVACSTGGAGPTGGRASDPSAAAASPDDGGRASQGPGRVDPREGGLDVALGEWALTLEAGAIRPGRVTFVIANRGTIGHGFEIEIEGNDSSGSGSGDDGLKAETQLLQPGETTRLTLNLPEGLYKVECLVDGHDDLGMEGFLEVRRDAPLTREDRDGGDATPAVAIRDFSFAPAELEIASGAEVTWTNDDPTSHTVTAEDGSFDSGELAPGETFAVRVEGNGPVTYVCRIHPDMSGTISVG